MQSTTLSRIWPSNFVQNDSEIQGLSPIPFIWVVGEKETGKSTLISTIDPVRPGQVSRTLVTDLEMSQETIKTQAPIDTYDVRTETRKHIGKDYTFKDLFITWRDYVLSVPQGKYSVLGVDPVSDLFQGAFMWVGDNSTLFGKTAQRYSGEMGTKAQWGDTALYWKQLSLELAQRYETTVFVSHLKDVYQNNVRTGNKAARGADFSEIATLILWLDRDTTGKRWALVKKSRLTWWDWGSEEEQRKRPILRDLLPRRLEPEYVGQSYPELIASYMENPQADYGELNQVPNDPSIEKLSEDDKKRIEAERTQGQLEIAVNDGRQRLIQELIQAGHYKTPAQVANIVAVLGEKYSIPRHDELFQKLKQYSETGNS